MLNGGSGDHSFLRTVIIPVVVGVAVGMLVDLFAWVLRELAVRRAADRALTQRQDGGTGPSA